MNKLPFYISSAGKLVDGRRDWWSLAVQRASQQIMAQEDEAIFKMLDGIAFAKSIDPGNNDI